MCQTCIQVFKAQIFIEENKKLNDCYFDKKDWRACTKEASATVEAPAPMPGLTAIRRWKLSKSVGRGKEMTSEQIVKMLETGEGEELVGLVAEFHTNLRSPSLLCICTSICQRPTSISSRPRAHRRAHRLRYKLVNSSCTHHRHLRDLRR